MRAAQRLGDIPFPARFRLEQGARRTVQEISRSQHGSPTLARGCLGGRVNLLPHPGGAMSNMLGITAGESLSAEPGPPIPRVGWGEMARRIFPPIEDVGVRREEAGVRGCEPADPPGSVRRASSRQIIRPSRSTYVLTERGRRQGLASSLRTKRLNRAQDAPRMVARRRRLS